MKVETKAFHKAMEIILDPKDTDYSCVAISRVNYRAFKCFEELFDLRKTETLNELWGLDFQARQEIRLMMLALAATLSETGELEELCGN